mgnify:CR=1 FL=1
MAKAYLISIYIEIHDPEKLKAYAVDARPAMEANGAQILARGTNLVSKEGNTPLRAVISEFESMEAAQNEFKLDTIESSGLKEKDKEKPKKSKPKIVASN